MNHRIKSAVPGKQAFRIVVTWSDGSRDTVDLDPVVHRLKAFAPIREPSAFRDFTVDEGGWAIRWSDELDYSADSLWRLVEEKKGRAMSAPEFRKWRTRLKFSLSGAAQMLGVSRRMVVYYDSGEKPVPHKVWLASRQLEAESTAKAKKARPRV
jgi:DNA-binding transcriptional regulator YiaG